MPRRDHYLSALSNCILVSFKAFFQPTKPWIPHALLMQSLRWAIVEISLTTAGTCVNVASALGHFSQLQGSCHVGNSAEAVVLMKRVVHRLCYVCWSAFVWLSTFAQIGTVVSRQDVNAFASFLARVESTTSFKTARLVEVSPPPRTGWRMSRPQPGGGRGAAILRKLEESRKNRQAEEGLRNRQAEEGGDVNHDPPLQRETMVARMRGIRSIDGSIASLWRMILLLTVMIQPQKYGWLPMGRRA